MFTTIGVDGFMCVFCLVCSQSTYNIDIDLFLCKIIRSRHPFRPFEVAHSGCRDKFVGAVSHFEIAIATKPTVQTNNAHTTAHSPDGIGLDNK